MGPRREGRRVFYSVVADEPLRRDALRHRIVGELLAEAESARPDRGGLDPPG